MLSVVITLVSVVITFFEIRIKILMRKHQVLDTETNEIIPSILLHRPKWRGEKFLMIFQEAFAYIAKDKTLTLETKNVLLYLLSRLDFENFVLVPHVEIAEELSMKRPNVSRAVKVLVEKHIIVEGPKVNRSRGFRLNHRFGWKGTLSNLRLLRKAEEKELLQNE